MFRECKDEENDFVDELHYVLIGVPMVLVLLISAAPETKVRIKRKMNTEDERKGGERGGR